MLRDMAKIDFDLLREQEDSLAKAEAIFKAAGLDDDADNIGGLRNLLTWLETGDERSV